LEEYMTDDAKLKAIVGLVVEKGKEAGARLSQAGLDIAGFEIACFIKTLCDSLLMEFLASHPDGIGPLWSTARSYRDGLAGDSFTEALEAQERLIQCWEDLR
jgi:hypothetical protein